MRYEHRTIYDWPGGELLAPWSRRNAPFRTEWARTLQQLELELEKLDATDVVLETAHAPSDLRLDGTLRGSAREPAHPGVVLSFESRYGPLRYYTDEFSAWRQNVRAIALGLEALRKLERYGITQRGQQYTGWAKLGPGTGQTVGTKPVMTRERAKEVIAEITGLHKTALVTADADIIKQMYRLAAKRAHPDSGNGDRARWDELTEAATALELK
jgi:hypothetical protein